MEKFCKNQYKTKPCAVSHAYLLGPFQLWRFLTTTLHVPTTDAHPGHVLNDILSSTSYQHHEAFRSILPFPCQTAPCLHLRKGTAGRCVSCAGLPNHADLPVTAPWQNSPAACAPATGSPLQNTPPFKKLVMPVRGAEPPSSQRLIRSRRLLTAAAPGTLCTPTASRPRCPAIPAGRQSLSQKVTLRAGGPAEHPCRAAPGAEEAVPMQQETAVPWVPGAAGRWGAGQTAQPEESPPLLQQVVSPSPHKISNSLPAHIWEENS